MIERKLQNTVGDASSFNLQDAHVIINCSSEHMDTTWFNNVRSGTIVCIQSSDVVDTEAPWFIKNPSPTLESFSEKYIFKQTLFED